MTHNETDYHQWSLPDEGAEGWHTTYYETLDDLDNKVFKTGPRSSRGSSAPSGAFYWATDEQTLFQYDGSSWQSIGTFWQGYELVIGNETPQTDQYIRFTTGSA